MITSSFFDRLIYKHPFLHDGRSQISNILGIDSEAYTDGSPFMFAVSNGDVLIPRDIPGILFNDYAGTNFMVYNLKYDSGALLYHLPIEQLKILWEFNEANYNGFLYKYIPHKLLRLIQDKESISFWDISQFYKMSLDNAAKRYLNMRKENIRTKKFSRKYVHYFWNYISKYCIKDALLTEKLGKYLVNKLDEFGITVTSLYSCASIAFKHFSDNSKIVTSWRFWNECPELLKYACDAYEGGKFEVTSRGKFTGFEYDITSAYPYEIMNLVDISKAKIERDKRYRSDAVYGFVRVYIDNSKARHIPCGVKLKNIRIYPAGKFYLTITKEEYEYLVSIGVAVEIISGIWLFVNRRRYPYRPVIDQLFEIKDRYKNNDDMLYNVSKIVMNSFYGKCVQCIRQPDDTYRAGAGWNPVYGAVITANTRIKVTGMQNLLDNDCLAVHTDSIISRVALDKHHVPGGIGNFESVISGSGVIIACGMYQIEDQCAFKGIDIDIQKIRTGRNDWKTLLSRHLNKSSISYPQLHVESWVESMAKNHEKNRINVFEKITKKIDLNCDTKRIWMKNVTGRDLLESNENSIHKFYVEIKQPEFWKNFS